ncbi:MAG: T9SS type A sorting domain-containing protein [Bacteroidales bacterium]|nr:T9SS type A sorting domain-containing protein [Bacteroidales bacterium]
MRKILSIFLVVLPLLSVAQFAPPAGQEGSTAIHADSPAFVAWASGCVVERGPMQIDKPENGLASYGVDADALGKPDGLLVVSLGDGGKAVLTFDSPICNGEGFDFAVFENPLKYAQDTNLYFLELAFVEVSSDGENYFRFPAVSLFPEAPQIGSFECTDPKLINNFAGKYASRYGTPFDLDELPDDELLNKDRITHVRLVDVVGCVNPEYATYDSEGHIVNDSWPTPFPSSGFDLDAVGVIHDVAHYSVGDQMSTEMLVYPNPVHNILSVNSEDVVSMTVFTLTGQQVLTSDNNRMVVSMLPQGVYLVRILTKDAIVVNRFIKN